MKFIQARKKPHGFTIVELLIVIVVIAILAGLVITSYMGIQQRARDSERQTDMRELATAFELFRADNGFYPMWSGTMNQQSYAENTLRDYVQDTSIFVAPRSDDPDFSIVTNSSSSNPQVAIDNLQPNQYYYYPVDNMSNPSLDPDNPRSYGLCPWKSSGGCKGFFLAWRSEADNELHIIRSLQK